MSSAIEATRTKWSKMTGAQRAEFYAAGIKDGSIPMCKRVRQAVDRWYDLRSRYPYNEDRLNKVISMIGAMKPPVGSNDAFLNFSPWQCWVSSWLYGFEQENGNRLIKELLLVVPRKAGKSTMTAAWGIIEMVEPWGDHVGGQVCYAGVTEKIANVAYKHLRSILRRDKTVFHSDGFTGTHEIKNNKTAVEVGRTNSEAFILTLGGESLDGFMLRMIVVDEIASLDDSGGIETLRTGMGADINSVMCLTTTPHDLFNSAYDEEREVGLQWLDGDMTNDNYAAIIYRAETDDLENEFKPELWAKVQPGYGDVVDEEFYQKAAARAKTSPLNLHRFRTRLLCADSVLTGVWISPKQIVDSRDPPKDPPKTGYQWFIGADTSDYRDMTALTLMGVHDDNEDILFYFDIHVPRSAVPQEGTGSKRDMEVREWAAQGHLTVHPDQIDHQIIADKMAQWFQDHKAVNIYLDNHSSGDEAISRLPQHIRRHRVVRRPKSYATVQNPMATLSAWVGEERAMFEKNPVAIDHFASCRILENREGAKIPTKTAIGGRKIDAVDSTLMAVMGHILTRDLNKQGTQVAPRRLNYKETKKKFPALVI